MFSKRSIIQKDLRLLISLQKKQFNILNLQIKNEIKELLKVILN